jgi:hypothetical protein
MWTSLASAKTEVEARMAAATVRDFSVGKRVIFFISPEEQCEAS